MTAPETYTVTRETLMAVLLTGYQSAMATAVANREHLATLKGIETDADAMEFGRFACDRILDDPASHDATWRVILAALSGVDSPMAVIKPERSGG